LNTDVFDYSLPEKLIAQKPADRRDESRLLVVNRQTHTVEHRFFRDLPEYLRAGDCLFRNNAAVIPARLHATRPTGGQVECLLLRPARTGWSAGDPAREANGDEWWCLLRPGKKLPVGATFGLSGIFTATVREKTGDGLVRVSFDAGQGDILTIANRIGEMPLPPYIERSFAHQNLPADQSAEAQRAFDRERYQTVYASRTRQVAAAAPTAGLHFTPELLGKLAAQGIASADLTLHVGLGTFRPITTDHIEDHPIHREVYEISAATQQAVFSTAGRRVAVGTTSVRTLEDYLSKNPAPLGRDCLAEAGIFIYPPRNFRGVDALITNFHQPRSTLLCLVSAFLTPGSTDGIAWLMEIYAGAIARDYRFFSYGDAMLIL
jgi:S-adenosylmethionine:tRNA ribosyltransferase-isomerase